MENLLQKLFALSVVFTLSFAVNAQKKYSNYAAINNLIPYLKNDKKNNDNNINFILLKKIGKTALPNKSKISINNLKKLSKSISQY